MHEHLLNVRVIPIGLGVQRVIGHIWYLLISEMCKQSILQHVFHNEYYCYTPKYHSLHNLKQNSQSMLR